MGEPIRIRVTPLHTCSLNNNVKAARAFLDHGASANTLDNDGDSILSQCLFNGANDVAELLLLRGATYTTWDSMGNSILHLAALSGSLRTVDILHNARLYEVDPDAVSHQGQTALQIAKARVSKAEGFVEKLQELLIDIRVRNAELRRTDAKKTGLAPERSHSKSMNKPLSSASRRQSQSYGLQGAHRTMALISRNLSWESALAYLLLGLIFYGLSHVHEILGFDWSGLSFA